MNSSTSPLVFPDVIIGLWQVADMERRNPRYDSQKAVAHLEAYLDAGLPFFDMADHYGSAELISGALREKRRREGKSLPILATKWVPEPGLPSREMVRAAVEKSMKRLQTDCIDLMQFHAWDYTHPGWMETMFHLDDLRKKGLIRALGVTNLDTVHLRMAVDSGIPIVSNQIAHSLLDQRAVQEMYAYCTANGIRLLAYGTVAGGFLSEKWLGKPEPVAETLETWSLMKYKRFLDLCCDWQSFQQILQELHRLSRKVDLTISQLASAFIRNQRTGNSVIIGARLGESEHIEANRALLHRDLPNELIEEVKALLKPLGSIPGDCGDEYRKPPFLTASGDLRHHLDTLPAPYVSEMQDEDRYRASSGTVWESFAGYSRAVRKGKQIFLSGTTATQGNRLVGGLSAASQMEFILDKMEGALRSMNGTIEDVVRTRVYVANARDWEAVARVHGRRFGNIRPANTLVIAGLIGEEYLVEVEMDAVAAN